LATLVVDDDVNFVACVGEGFCVTDDNRLTKVTTCREGKLSRCSPQSSNVRDDVSSNIGSGEFVQDLDSR
jgi:hypothetical protein